MKIRQYENVVVVCGENEPRGVRIAARNLIRDLRRVLDCNVESESGERWPGGIDGLGDSAQSGSPDGTDGDGRMAGCSRGKTGSGADWPGGPDGAGRTAAIRRSSAGGMDDGRRGTGPLRIVVGTAEHSGEICRRARLERLRDDSGAFRREAYLIQEQEGDLLIAGSDRRGAIYGIYEFCERWLGVSPWYFFADVPVRSKREVEVPEGFLQADWPSVEYRGIFINDEEELEHWAQRYIGEPTIGVKTYERIFELLLRLKLNYIWPAMHVNSFNAVRENGALAHEMGIVVGTSHCDMLMRSNNREWKPWLKKKGYQDAAYDFSLPGRNREILKEYWRESVEQNKDFEVSYTLGMRGIHDSGFEVRALAGKSGKELLKAKISLLEAVIETQEALLEETLGHETAKTFVPYKEVLELYDNGLAVPEDLTLIWVNDNYGYVRRYPGEAERRRKGGNGLYYHNSYWAPPGASYLFLCSVPLAHTRNELKKAYEEGVRKIWVTNFGAMKPLEQQISFYAAYAWEAGREGGCTEDGQRFLREWIDRTFSGGHGCELAPLLAEFDQLTNARKVEQMDFDAFSQTAYGDEAAGRIHRYERMFDTVNRIWKALPGEEQDGFFQMVGMKIHAAYFTNLMYYYGDRSNLCMGQGKKKAAQKYTDLGREADHARRSMLYYYNHVMANGKWNGILTPEDFPPPRTAMHPACMPPVGGLSAERLSRDAERAERAGAAQGITVTVWNEGQEIVFTRPALKWIELGTESDAPAVYLLHGPDWIRFADSGTRKTECTVEAEARILFEPDREKVCGYLRGTELQSAETPTEGQGARQWAVGSIMITDSEGRLVSSVPVSVQTAPLSTEEAVEIWSGAREGSVEDDGRICVEAGKGAAWGQASDDRTACDKAVGDGADCTKAPDGAASCKEPSAPLGCPAGWRLISDLGRDSGSLLEAEEEGAEVSWQIIVLTEGSHLLELHRFPSLNSVGAIRVGVSVDQGEAQLLESESNDEHKGSWKENVRNNVDKLYLRLPYLEAGAHRITFCAVSKYFAFSRFVVYTKERRENSLGRENGDQHLPAAFDGKGFVRQMYGKEAAGLLPRPVYYLPRNPQGDSLAMEDIVVQPACWGRPVKGEELVELGRDISEEKDGGGMLIECASALAESLYARTGSGLWKWCTSPSHGETGLAMYIRQAKRTWTEEEAPSLHYRIRVQGGEYRIWVRAMMWGDDTSHFTVCLDGERVPERALYGGHGIWRYSNEQVWKWIPVWEASLEAGEHELALVTFSARLRFEQIYLTRGEELPPALG